MKIYFIIPVTIFLLTVTSCKEDPPDAVTGFTASNGNYIGIIHLVAEPAAGAENYNFQRKNPQTGQWDEIYWGSNIQWDDNGWGLPDNKLIAGQNYEYRVRTHANSGGYGDYSETVSGSMFSPKPVLVKLKYEIASEDWGTYNLTYKVRDLLPPGIQNLQGRMLSIYRSNSSDMLTYYSIVVKEITYTNKDSVITETVLDSSYNPDQDYFYRLKVDYDYGYNGESNWITDRYNYDSPVYKGSDITEKDTTSVPTVDYTIQAFGDITTSASDGKTGLKMCSDGSTVYLGFFDSFNGLTGKPRFMKNSGSSWSNVAASMPSDYENDKQFTQYNIDASSGVFYLSALSYDTIHIYRYDGSWSANMATSVLSNSSENEYTDIAILNNIPYFTVKQGDDIKVFKYQDSNWEQTGDIVASGDAIWHTGIKNIDGKLYIWYEESDSETSVILHVKHLEGNSWINDLQWAKSTVASGFDLVSSDGKLYFKYQTFDAKGNICRITSSTTCQELYSNTTGLFDPISITTDNIGNIIINCITGTAADNFHQEVMLYDGSGWQSINDNFSETSFHGNAGSVQSSGSDIHFVYGLKSSENASQFPTILKAKKYSK